MTLSDASLKVFLPASPSAQSIKCSGKPSPEAADIRAPAALFEPVDLIYAALILEYVDPPVFLTASWQIRPPSHRPGGISRHTGEW